MKEIPYVLIAVMTVIFALSWLLMRGASRKKNRVDNSTQKDAGKRGDAGRCPVCNATLLVNERIKSAVYTGGNDSDKRCTIMGCPHCFPYVERGLRRACPVCTKTIPPEGYLIARMFARDGKKRHVHIVGCTECHKRQ